MGPDILTVYAAVLEAEGLGTTRMAIEEGTGVGTSSCQACLSALVQLGLVTTTREKVPGLRGGGVSTYYPSTKRIQEMRP